MDYIHLGALAGNRQSIQTQTYHSHLQRVFKSRRRNQTCSDLPRLEGMVLGFAATTGQNCWSQNKGISAGSNVPCDFKGTFHNDLLLFFQYCFTIKEGYFFLIHTVIHSDLGICLLNRGYCVFHNHSPWLLPTNNFRAYFNQINCFYLASNKIAHPKKWLLFETLS